MNRLRIAFVVADEGIPIHGSKGASVHAQEMIRAFHALGHEVFVFAARRGDALTELPAHLTEVQVPSEIATAPDQKRRLREAHAMRLSDAISAALVSAHSRAPFDLIYERYSLFSTAGVRASERLAIPLALEVNSPLVLEQQRYRKLAHVAEAEAIERTAFSRAACVFAVSEEVARYCETHGARPGASQVLPNGVDAERFRPRVDDEVRAPHSGFVVGFSGSLKPWHGIDVLMQAFVLLAAAAPESSLLVAGRGPLGDWLDGFSAGAGLSDRVTQAGWVGHDRLPAVLRSMDVAVAPYPALEDFYFSPLKLYEYMAAGLPVVASRLGQLERVIEHGHNGLLVEAGEPDAIATALMMLRNDPALRAQMANAARQTALGHSWIRNAQAVTGRLCPSEAVAGAEVVR